MTPPKNAAYHSNLVQLLKAVAVAHEMEEAAPGRQDTRHGTRDSHARLPGKGMSDSRRLVAHDHVLVQCRREHHASSDILDMHRNVELPEVAEEPGESAPVVLSKKSAPVVLSKKHSRDALPAPPFHGSHCFLG